MYLFDLIKREREKKNSKKMCGKITLRGDFPEIVGNIVISLGHGSTKTDVVLGSDVGFFSGCSLLSRHHGQIIIGDHVRFQRNIRIYCVDKIVIGDYTAIASNVCIVDNNNHPVNPSYRQYMRTTPHGDDARLWIHSDHKPIIIGKNCWIGENSRIQKGVTIGDNSIVAACSVVTKDVPANCIAAGNPAKIVKTDIDKIPAPTSCREFNDYISSKDLV